MSQPRVTQEQIRLHEARDKKVPWRKWGPYLSERQWGGVRENMNTNVEAWNDFTHDQARSRAYRSGEDGIPVNNPSIHQINTRVGNGLYLELLPWGR